MDDVGKAALNFLVITTPLLIFYMGYRIERKRNIAERKDKYRIQFDVQAKLIGSQAGYYIIDLSLLLHNMGLVRFEPKELKLQVRGIKRDSSIELFDKHGTNNTPQLLAEFPIKLVDTNVFQAKTIGPKDGQKKSYFVEPGVAQCVSHVARIPDNISFIMVRGSFEYGENSQHSTQTILALDHDK